MAPSTAAAATLTPTGAITELQLGPGDEADISVYGVPEMTQHVRISSTGEISFPLLGTVKVAGLTAEQAQALLEKLLVEGNYLKNPHVTFYVKDYTSQGVSVLGEVARPGNYSVLNARRLFDAFLAAGGLTARAGNTVTIARRDHPSRPDVIQLSNDPLKSVENNVPLKPGDTVVVSRAGIIYVLGEVVRPGGFVIDNNAAEPTISQLLAMAAGPTRMASLSHAQVMRRTPNGLETTGVDLNKIMKDKADDRKLKADDIVFIPPSKGRMAAQQGGGIMTALATAAIYRF